MFSKIILYAFSDQLTAGVWRLGRLAHYQVFRRGADDENAFRQFLLGHRNIPLHLLVDVVEEDYRLETLPHTLGPARRALVERRLNQLYRNSPFRAAYPLGREQAKRRDDIYLFQALTKTDSIAPWLAAVVETGAPLAGIYLQAMVAQTLVSHLKLNHSHLLLSDQQITGLRQSYFHQGKLRVSRLAPANFEAERLVSLTQEETEKTWLYLLSQHLIQADTKLSLLVLSSSEEAADVCRVMNADPGIECLQEDVFALGRRLGLRAQDLQTNPELLYMQLLATHRTPANLAPPAQTKGYFIHRLSTAMWVAVGLVMLLGLGAAGQNAFSTLETRAQTSALRAQTGVQEKLYQEVSKNFPATPINSAQLKTAVELARTLANYPTTPHRLIRPLAAALDSMPEIKLRRLRWRLSEDINAKDEELPGAATSNSATAGAVDGQLYETGFLDGEMANFSGDYRAAIARVDHLASLLGKDPQVQRVEILQLPVNASSKTNLEGNTLDSAGEQQTQPAQFKIKIVLKPAGARP